MKKQKIVATMATCLLLCMGVGVRGEAADVYKVDRYGELYDYSGSPTVKIRSHVSAIRRNALKGVRTVRFSADGNPYFKTIGGVLYSKDGTLLIKCPTEKSGSFAVPATVTKIADGAFEDCTKLTKVTIPASVKTIGESCFENATSLRSATIGNGVTKIPEDSFYGCSNLTSVKLPAKVTSIERYSFGNCQKLTHISLPDSVASIGYNVFRNCISLKTVRYSKKLDVIESGSFQNCTSLTSISNVENVEEVGGRAFYNCIKLRGFAFGDKLDSIRWEAFANCESLGVVKIPQKTTRISADAFTNAASRFVVHEKNPNYASYNGMLMNESKEWLIQIPTKEMGDLKLPNGTKGIYSQAFWGDEFKSITIPEGVKKVGKKMFRDCENLQSIYLPGSLEKLEQLYYYDMEDLNVPKLQRIVISKDNLHYTSEDGVLYSKDGKEMVFFPMGRKGTVVLPDTCKRIGSQMKKNQLSAIRVSRENKYFTSKEGVLYDLRGKKIRCFPINKKSYVIPKTVTDIAYLDRVKEDLKCASVKVEKGNRKFSSKQDVVFSKNGDALLFYPTGKKGKYVIPKSTTRIQAGAFENAKKLTSLTITKNVKNGGTRYYLWNCYQLKEVIVKEGKLNYIRLSFDGSNKLKKLSFPSNVMKTELRYLPEGVVIHGWNNTWAKESAQKAKGKFVSKGTIPKVVTGPRVRKIIDTYQLSWNASSEASGYQIYTVDETIQNLSGAGNTSCYIDEDYLYDTIYVRAYRMVHGKKVYGKARAIRI